MIGFYYGVFPDWMPYWLRSCADNETIDFFLVTDIGIGNVPGNVRVIEMSLQEVKQRAEAKLGMEVFLQQPYKLCDFKPVYGVIMDDYLKEYDYWGHCDFDLIWGDIRRFAEMYHLKEYDKFLPLGHLALYRNTDKCNNYFRLDGSRCGDYKAVLTQNENFAFDETDGIYSIYEHNGLPMFTKRIFAEIKTFHKRFRLKACDRNYKHQVFYYEDGKLYRAYEKNRRILAEEFIYMHFRRKLPANAEIDWKTIKAFYITPDGFVEKRRGMPALDEIEMYNHNSGWIVELWETVKFCSRNISKIKSKVENEFLALKQNRG